MTSGCCVFRFGDREWRFDGGCVVMGIVNVTPDSFSDGGEHPDASSAIAHGLGLWEAGAAWLDVGGESTRPGAAAVTAEEEIRRVVPVIRGLRERTAAVISIDTTKAAVADAALAAGAHVVNDVSALQADPGLAEVLAATGAGCILMHSRGTPATMRTLTHYDDVAADVRRELGHCLESALARSGLPAEHFMTDPGIGFAKTPAQSLALISAIAALRDAFGRPVLMGPSRKSFIGHVLDQPDPHRRLWGTAGAVAACVLNGADVVRVHDVREMADVVRVCAAIRAAAP
ncbi:MAG: dihydropteroate synthase [Lentisphaerae bacterium]|nr:dihydropteroate synthase [Lentisphaerota bacterium]